MLVCVYFWFKDLFTFNRRNKNNLMMKEISTVAKLSQIYTTHSVRATSVTLLDRAGIPVHRIMQLSGYRNETSVKVCCERRTFQQERQRFDISAALVATTSTALATEPVQQTEQRSTNTAIYHQMLVSATGWPKFIDFTKASFQNCTFLFNYKNHKNED